MTSARSPRRSVPARVIRVLIVAMAAFVLLPYLLVPLYRVIDPISTLMLARWVSGKRVDRTVVQLSQIVPTLPRTVIASEDARFCRHRGIDWGELRAAIEEADELSEARGASTITQQTVKNLFLWPGRSYVRKALEFPLAAWTELVLPKRRIMEIYLNIAEWGPNGEFGAQAGARAAFGKNARDLSPREAALLASVLPNPKRRSARQPGAPVQRLAGIYAARAARSPHVGACVRPPARAAKT